MSYDLSPEKRSTRQLTRRGVLWLGLRCDIRCKFCYDEKVAGSSKIWVSLEQATAALKKFHDYYENNAVDFMGGEPTLHPQIVDIVRYAANIGLKPTIITHGMHLSDPSFVKVLADAGVHDFLVSIHGIGSRVNAIHQRGSNNYERQIVALDNLRAQGIPFRFNCTVIKDNLDQLLAIVKLAADKGARVLNFLIFNPYFEWSFDEEIEFQAQFSEVRPYLDEAIQKCLELGIEANVRYLPICQLPGKESHIYTGFQLPFDTHEWDYNSWYDFGHSGQPNYAWYRDASNQQRTRHNYIYVEACENCSVRLICDGFHRQYVARWGGGEARPFIGEVIENPGHYIDRQSKVEYPSMDGKKRPLTRDRSMLTATQFSDQVEHRAGLKSKTLGIKGR